MHSPVWKDTSKLTTYIIKDVNNDDNYEIFLVNKTKKNAKIIDACAKATTEIEGLLDRGTYFTYTIYRYRKDMNTNELLDEEIKIKIPEHEYAKKIDNRFEMFAALLEMNGIVFKRPEHGFQVVEMWL